MHEKKFSVFISSTYEDLRPERQAVQDAVISAGDFPVGMESFPAADEDQFDFIRSLIDKCDYYVLIVAGRYGSLATDGLSYTEKEYRYAVSKQIPILAMIHGDRESLPLSKTERTDEGRSRLDKFIKEVERGRVRRFWTTKDALKLAVREALDHAKATKLAIGWIRGDTIASIDALEELNEVRKENAKFREQIGSLDLDLALPPMPSASDEIQFDLLHTKSGYGYVSSAYPSTTIRASWIDLFPLFFFNLKFYTSNRFNEDCYFIDEDESCIQIGSAIASEANNIEYSNEYRIKKSTLRRLVSYYIESGLMNSEYYSNPFTEAAQKVARRHDIADKKTFILNVIHSDTNSNIARTSILDDEIPF